MLHEDDAQLPNLLAGEVERQVLQAGLTGDWAIARLAELQYGVVSRAQLMAVGLGRGAVSHRLKRSRLHPVHRGVYRVGHTAPLPLAREMAALLACGGRAVLSHRSAAALWAFVPWRGGAVDVTSPAYVRRPGIRIHRSALAPMDITRCRRLPVTTPERTLIDLAAEVRPPELERTVGDAQRRGLVTASSLRAALERSPRRRGTAHLGALLRREDGPAFTRSEAEVRFLALVRAAGLPAPEHNVTVGPYQVDILWREQGLVVEVDGYAYHSGRAAFERDRARDADLQAAGLRVMRVSWRQLSDERETVVARLARALADAAPGLWRAPGRLRPLD